MRALGQSYARPSFQLFLHAADVSERVLPRVHPARDRRVFRGEAERVPISGIEGPPPGHPFPPIQGVARM